MILYVKYEGQEPEHFVLARASDFEPLLARYPSIASLIIGSSSVEDAADRVSEYLNSGHLMAWTSADEMSKAIPKNLMAAAGIGMALMGTPANQPVDMRHLDSVHPPHTMVSEPFGNRPEDSFLWNIKQIESSGGKNITHRQVKHGMHAGESAVGRFGLMPKTIMDVAHRIRGSGKTAPEIDQIAQMPEQQVGQFLLQRPDVELNVARFLARHVLHRHKNDEKRASYSWLHGHNLHPEDISDADLGDPYVQKYTDQNSRNPFKQAQIQAMPIQKADDKLALSTFRDQMRAWMKYRNEHDTEEMHDNTWVPDPGRQRDDNKYEKPTGAELIRDYVASRAK